MPAVAPVPWQPFWGHDENADPLSGGQLYAYEAGTDTPRSTYQDPAGTVLNAHPVVLDDAGYAPVFLMAGVAYKLRLEDRLGVQQWEIDQVYGGGGGAGSGTAGVGWGKNTVDIRPTAGSAQATVPVFPADTLAVGLTVWIETTLGTSQGLAQIGLGTGDLPDCWGVLDTLSADTETTVGVFLAYGGQPQPVAGMVTLTAYGGLFDGSGSVYLTGHFVTMTPGHTVGYSYTPGLPADGQILPPLPAATETVAGIVELATSAEVTIGTDDLRAVTPLKLQAALASGTHLPTASETVRGLVELATQQEVLDGVAPLLAVTPAGLAAKVPTGTALSVLRYAASGQALEATPGLLSTSDGRLGVGGTAPEAAGVGLQMTQELRLRTGGYNCINATFGPYLNSTTYHDTATTGFGIGANRARGTEALPQAAASGDTYLVIGGKGHDGTSFPGPRGAFVTFVAAELQTPTARGARITASVTLAGTTTQAEVLRLDSNGYVGVKTTTPKFPLDVIGALAYGVPTAEPVSTDLGNGQMVWWFNQTDNTLRALIKRSDGTLRRATIATTT